MSRLNGRCPICLGEFIPDQISALRCGHTFHYSCILQWLQTSKTCPECRSFSTERNLIRQLFFNSGDVTQLSDDFMKDEEALSQKVIEMKQELAAEQRAHSETAEKLQKAEKQCEKAEALCSQEKKKVKHLTTQIAHMQQLELMLVDQQELERKLERYKSRLRATELYALLAGSSSNCVTDDAKIDKLLGSNGDPDIQKFLELMKKQYENVKRRLHEMENRMEAAHRSNLELRVKLDKHKKLNVAFKEELSSLSGDISEAVINPRLNEVIACSPEISKPLFEFDLSDDEVFSKSLMKSALKVRSRPVLHPIIKQESTRKRSSSPLLGCSSFPSPSCIVASSTEKKADTDVNTTNSDKWDVKVAKPVSSTVRCLSKRKPVNVKGAKKLCDSGCRSKGITSLLTTKAAKNKKSATCASISDLFSERTEFSFEKDLNESVIILD